VRIQPATKKKERNLREAHSQEKEKGKVTPLQGGKPIGVIWAPGLPKIRADFGKEPHRGEEVTTLEQNRKRTTKTERGK